MLWIFSSAANAAVGDLQDFFVQKSLVHACGVLRYRLFRPKKSILSHPAATSEKLREDISQIKSLWQHGHLKSKSIVKILKLALKIPPSQDVFIPKCLPQIYLHCDGVALLGAPTSPSRPKGEPGGRRRRKQDEDKHFKVWLKNKNTCE